MRPVAIPAAETSPAISGLDLMAAAQMSPVELAGVLGSSESGLTSAEAKARLDRFGPNAVRSHGARLLAVLGRQLRNPPLAPTPGPSRGSGASYPTPCSPSSQPQRSCL